MFSATITGTIKRFLHDNEQDAEKAMVKVVMEVRKQFAKKDDMPNVYPVVTIFGHDAAYLRDYAGVGAVVQFFNCDIDVYRPDDADKKDPDRISFKAGKVELLAKAYSEALIEAGVAEEAGSEDEDDRKKKKKKGKGKEEKKSSKGKSRSERRNKDLDDDDDEDEDEDDEEEDEKPKKKPKKDEKKKPKKEDKKSSKKSKKVEDDDDDEDYDDDDYDDDDDYFDED